MCGNSNPVTFIVKHADSKVLHQITQVVCSGKTTWDYAVA